MTKPDISEIQGRFFQELDRLRKELDQVVVDYRQALEAAKLRELEDSAKKR